MTPYRVCTCLQADCAPLPKVLQEHKKEQEALQQQLEDKVAEFNTADDSMGLAEALNRNTGISQVSGADGVGFGAAPGGSATAAGVGATAAVQPVMVPPEYTEAEKDKWARTDAMIMRVFGK